MANGLYGDEHAVPTGLNSRVPIFAYDFPWDWTMRQALWAAGGVWFGSMGFNDAPDLGSGLLVVLLWAAVAAVGIIAEYVVSPTPEFWLLGWFEYLAVLLLSFPLWCKRLLYAPRKGVSWPLATLPHWLGARMVANITVLPDGMVRLPKFAGGKPTFAVALGIDPVPHPDLLPMLVRESMVWTRLAIFRRIRGHWAIHLQVRPYPQRALEVASGPAWGWVATEMAPYMVLRRPLLVLYGADSYKLRKQSEVVLRRLASAAMHAWPITATGARALAAELWAEVGYGSSGRVRIGLRRVMTGARIYRSWAITELPRVIHLSWLRPLTREALIPDLGVHVYTRAPGPTRRDLARKKLRWRAVATDENYDMAVQDAENTLDDMRRNTDTETTIGMYVTAREEEAAEVAEALEATQCEFRPALTMQHRALRAVHPYGGDPYGRTFKADMRTVATTDLLATAGYMPAGATLLGEALSAPEPIGINPFDDTVNLNPAVFISIIMGGGKTTLAQTLAWRMANPHKEHPLYKAGVEIISIDFKPTGDYVALYRHLAKQHLADPLHCMPAAYNVWDGGGIPPIDGHVGFNLSNIPEGDRGQRLLELTERIEEWVAANALDHPVLLLVDEILALLEARGGPNFIKRHGTQARSSNMAPVFMTQDIESVLKNAKAALAFKNAGHVFLGRQTPAGINAMAPLLSLEDEVKTLLVSAPQGAGILRIERKTGPVMLGVQVRPTEWELFEFGTNPSERLARRVKEVHTVTDSVREEAVYTNGHAGSAVLDSPFRSANGNQAGADAHV